MNLVKYEIFVESVKQGSLSKAAEKMGYTQSGVSHMMKSLEAEVGFPLFTRTGIGIQPNSAGKLLLPLILDLLQKNEHLNQEIAAIRGLETGNVHVASFSSVAIFWLPAILRRFEQKHPNISVRISEGGVKSVEDLLFYGNVDLAIYAKTDRRDFDWIPLKDDPLYVILPKDHPLSRAKTFPPEAFMYNDFIAPDEKFDYHIHKILKKLECFPRIKFISENDFTIISMVANGLGISIMPKLMLRDCLHKISALPISPSFFRKLGIGVRCLKEISPAAYRFIQTVQDVVKDLEREHG